MAIDSTKLEATVTGTNDVVSDERPLAAASSSALRDEPRYAERGLLGRGGMGDVHLRFDRWLGRDVAVKTLTKERADLGAAQARFLREAKVQGQLQHPAVVPVYDIGTDEDGRTYFTMKRIAGTTLRDLLGEPDATRNRLLGVLRQVCLAIDYAHAEHVVHRDLKPANVMVGSYGEVYVLDWGVAKIVGPRDCLEPNGGPDGGTLSGHMIGTPGYMAPEQISAASEADDRADVYALGAMLFEILAGEPLHRGRGTDELLRSAERATIERPSERAPHREIPPELDEVCVQAIEPDREKRRLGARDLAVAIERYLDGDRDLAARRAHATRHADAAAAAADRALGASADAIDARASALKEAGRALTLDPENVSASRTLIDLVARPPTILPEEVRAKLEEADRDAMRIRNRKGVGLMFVFLAFIVSLPLQGVRSWPLFATMLVPFLGALGVTLWVLFSRDLSADRFERRTDWVVGFSLATVLTISLATTSIVIVPALALAIAMGAAGAARRRRRVRYLLMGLAAFAVPFIVEWTHLLPGAFPGVKFVDGGMLVPEGLFHLRDVPFRMLVLLATSASILTPGLTVIPVLDASAALRKASLLQAWQMRQLAPDASTDAR